MEILVDGNRSTSESWLEARRIPAQSLPDITPDEQRVAEKLSIATEDYRRSKYAADLTKRVLQGRASHVGHLVEDWLRGHGLTGEVKAVWLKTFEGKFRVDVQLGNATQAVFAKEELIDELLESGSEEARRSFDRLLTANLLERETARAS